MVAKDDMLKLRTIPARAGKPSIAWSIASEASDHPRAGGETAPGLQAHADHGGPSPRGRGNHAIDTVGGLGERTIPARAGKPFNE